MTEYIFARNTVYPSVVRRVYTVFFKVTFCAVGQGIGKFVRAAYLIFFKIYAVTAVFALCTDRYCKNS